MTEPLSLTRVAFLVNGGYESAMGHRARELADRLSNRYSIRISYRSPRKILSIARFIAFLVQNHPRITYVFDMAYSGVAAAALYKMILRNRVIIDTGDCISALARSMGRTGLALGLTDALENSSFRIADRTVVRGTFHRELLESQGIRTEVIQDGVDAAQFAPQDAMELRGRFGVDRVVTVGIVGTSIWSEKLQMCYGWELVEMLRLLDDAPVRGIFIGNGSGVERLKVLCRQYGIEDKMIFLGYIPYGKLPSYVAMIDICLSTQTNDLAGRVRTTGKLPLYLASGRYILASNVGEAAIVLDPEMLVDYNGVKDPEYPARLADRVRRLLDRKIPFEPSSQNIAIGQQQFDYSVLSERLARVIEDVRR